MTYDEMIEVIAAHRDGKPIQYRCVGNELWHDFYEDEEPTFNAVVSGGPLAARPVD